MVAGEGLHFVAPWQIITVYDLRYQTIESEFTVLAKDGLDVQVHVTTRYRPSERELTNLHQEVGPQYAHTIVEPEVGTAVRVVTGQFEPEQFYSAGLMQMQERVIEVARERVRTRYVDVDDVFIRNIVMPTIVAEAIQHKIQQEQAALTMFHLLERERQEADRKRIEAAGIRDFQATISTGLTNQFLRYKGIEATQALASSTNAKIVVVGSGVNGLPILFNADSMAPGGAQPVALAPFAPVAATPAANATPNATTPLKPPQ